MATTPSYFPFFPTPYAIASPHHTQIHGGYHYPHPAAAYPPPPPGFVPVPANTTPIHHHRPGFVPSPAYMPPPAPAYAPPPPVPYPPPAQAYGPFGYYPAAATPSTAAPLAVAATPHANFSFPSTAENSDLVFHRATPEFRCQDSKTEEDGSAPPRQDFALHTEKSGSATACKDCALLVEPVLNAPTIQSAEAQAQAEATISKDVPRAVRDLKRRLDAQLARDRTSFDTIKGELAKLTSMASQFALSISKQTNSAIPTSSSLRVTGTAPVASKVFGKQSSAAENSSASSLSSPVGASSSVSAQTFASVSATCASTTPSNTAFVAPHVFGELPRPNFGHGTPVIAPRHDNCCSGYSNQIHSSCVQGGSTNLSEQNIDGLPQAYGLHNLICRTVVRADGTEHSYYALPGDYPLERATPEPLFSKESVGVFASKPGQQPYEKEQQEGDRLLTCSSKALEIDSTGACLNIISDVHDLPLELQQHDDVKACNVPVLKASDSVVTSSSKLSSTHVLRGLRWLWDPGASAFRVTPMKNDSSNYFSSPDKTDIWSQSEHQFIVHRMVSEEVMLDKPPAKPPDRFGIADSSLQAMLLKVQRSEKSPTHTHCNLLCCNSQQLSVFKMGNFAISTLWRHTTQGSYICSLYCDSVLKMSSVWDPGIESLLVFYKWMHIQIIQLVHCSAQLSPTQITAYCPSNIRFVHQQGVEKYCNEKNLLSSPIYLQLLELDIIFITFLPP